MINTFHHNNGSVTVTDTEQERQKKKQKDIKRGASSKYLTPWKKAEIKNRKGRGVGEESETCRRDIRRLLLTTVGKWKASGAGQVCLSEGKRAWLEQVSTESQTWAREGVAFFKVLYTLTPYQRVSSWVEETNLWGPSEGPPLRRLGFLILCFRRGRLMVLLVAVPLSLHSWSPQELWHQLLSPSPHVALTFVWTPRTGYHLSGWPQNRIVWFN